MDSHELALTKGQVATVDAEDYERLSKFKWYAAWHPFSKTFYVQRATRLDGHRTTISMHREILRITDPRIQVDHRDHNGLNNRRENLRVCSSAENNRNQRKRSGCSSRYKGVCWYRRDGLWKAYIRSDGRVVHLGYFSSEEDAARAYDAAARKAFGEFALTNF